MAMDTPKKHKARRVVLYVVLVAAVLYFGGGIIATCIVNHMVFDHRSSDESLLAEPQVRIYKQRADYPLLSVRDEYDFPGTDGKLHGYHYRVPDEKGLVLFAHGMSSCSDGREVAVENLYLELGFSVFAVDLTASGKSEGQSMRNLSQSAHDVVSAYSFIQEKDLLPKSNFVLSGYSWGGHGVAASLGLGVKADKLITFAAFDCPYDEMVTMAVSKVSPVIYAGIPPFVFTTWCYYGQEVFSRASDVVKASGVKGLFIQGENDAVVPLRGASLYEGMEGSGQKLHLTDSTHKAPWLSKEARKYISDEIEPELSKLDLNNKEEIDSFIASVDKEKSSALDAAMVAKIQALLNE